jgi:hypothetical protein
MTKRRKKILRRTGGCRRRPRIHLADPAPAPEPFRKKPERRKRRGRNRKRSKLLEGEPTRDGGVAVLAELGRERVLVAHLSPTQRVSLCLSMGSSDEFLENKGTTSRFGFLSSAKNLVKNVWKGAGTAEPPKPTNIPVASSSKAPVKPVASTSKPPPVTNESTSSKNSKGSFKPISRFGFGSGSKTTATTSTTASSVTSSSRHDSMGQRKRESELRGVTNTDGTANSRVSNVSSNSSIGTGRVTGAPA